MPTEVKTVQDAIRLQAERYNAQSVEFRAGYARVDVTFPTMFSASAFVQTFELRNSAVFVPVATSFTGDYMRFDEPFQVTFNLNQWPDKFNPERKLTV